VDIIARASPPIHWTPVRINRVNQAVTNAQLRVRGRQDSVIKLCRAVAGGFDDTRAVALPQDNRHYDIRQAPRPFEVDDAPRLYSNGALAICEDHAAVAAGTRRAIQVGHSAHRILTPILTPIRATNANAGEPSERLDQLRMPDSAIARALANARERAWLRRGIDS
jgi:hypothetical protein